MWRNRMKREEIYSKLTDVFRDVFDNAEIVLSDTTTADDIDGWDSLENVILVVAIEKMFGIRLTMPELNGLENVGQMVDVIEKKVS